MTSSSRTRRDLGKPWAHLKLTSAQLGSSRASSHKARALAAKRARGSAAGDALATATLAATFRESDAWTSLEAELALAHGDGTKPPVAVPAHLQRASPLRVPPPLERAAGRGMGARR